MSQQHIRKTELDRAVMAATRSKAAIPEFYRRLGGGL